VSVPPEPQTVDERIDLSGIGLGVIPLTAAQLALTGKSDRHCCGLATMPSSRVWKCPSIRVMVSALNKSVLFQRANQSLFGIEHRQEYQTSLCRYRPIGFAELVW